MGAIAVALRIPPPGPRGKSADASLGAVGCWRDEGPRWSPPSRRKRGQTTDEWLELSAQPAPFVRGGASIVAEGVGFEPTDPCGSPDFESGALDQAMRPLHEIIPGGATQSHARRHSAPAGGREAHGGAAASRALPHAILRAKAERSLCA